MNSYKTVFTHADILKATSSFSEDRVIGKGGFGTVYKGVFSDGRQVAVKKLQRTRLTQRNTTSCNVKVTMLLLCSRMQEQHQPSKG